MPTNFPHSPNQDPGFASGRKREIAMAALTALLSSALPGAAQSQSTGNRCLPGTYYPGVTPPVSPARCIPAPDGTYVPGFGATSAIPAPVGSYVRSPGATNYEKGTAPLSSNLVKNSSASAAATGGFLSK
jgi:hypothetical protein